MTTQCISDLLFTRIRSRLGTPWSRLFMSPAATFLIIGSELVGDQFELQAPEQDDPAATPGFFGDLFGLFKNLKGLGAERIHAVAQIEQGVGGELSLTILALHVQRGCQRGKFHGSKICRQAFQIMSTQ
jgi:hypothetical protein